MEPEVTAGRPRLALVRQSGNLRPMPNDYRSVLAVLENSKRELKEVAHPRRSQETLVWLRQLRFAEIKAADAACEEFAATESWPPMQVDSVVAQVHLRLANAISLCRTLLHATPPDGKSRREMLRLMLLDYWHGKVSRLLVEAETRSPGPANREP